MAFWFTLFLFIATSVIGELLRPRPKFDKPTPSGLGDFALPTAQEGRAIPALWGTVHQKGGNVVWYGDLTVEPITETVSSGLFGLGSTTITTGYRYYLGVQIVLGWGPIDELLDVRFDDRSIPGLTVVDSGDYYTVTVPAGAFRSVSGGISGITFRVPAPGTIRVYKGTDTQTPDPYLVSKLGALPAYKGLCYAVLEHLYVGESPFIKPISFIVRRQPNGLLLPGGTEAIGLDANAAAVIQEVLAEPRWGLGVPGASIDLVSLRAAGATLAAEGLGVSVIGDTQQDASEFLSEIGRHVDGILYLDPRTALLTAALARPDYALADLPVFDATNISRCKLTRPAWSETRNSVKITYTDRSSGYVERVAQAMDLASIEIQGGARSEETFDFGALATPAAAQLVAARVLKTLSYPLARLELTVDRTLWPLRPGQPFRLTWAPLGIVDLVCRITRITDGDPRDGTITVDAVEDIFGATWAAFDPPPPSEWTDPDAAAGVPTAQALLEAPYGLLAAADRRVLTLCARNGGGSRYEVWSDPAGGTSYTLTNTVDAFTPSGLLHTTVSRTATSFVVEAGPDTGLLQSATADGLALGVNLGWIGDELFAWLTTTDNGDGTFTLSGIVRGVLDTTPAPHTAAARLYFPSYGVGLSAIAPYPHDVTLAAKLLPVSPRGGPALSALTAVSGTTTSRATRPNLPRNVLLNGASYPATIVGQLVIGWAHRNRLDPFSYADGGVTASIEPATHYRIKIFGDGGTLKHTEDNLTGTSWTYLTATEQAENGGISNTTLRVVIESLTDAMVPLASQFAYDFTTSR